VRPLQVRLAVDLLEVGDSARSLRPRRRLSKDVYWAAASDGLPVQRLPSKGRLNPGSYSADLARVYYQTHPFQDACLGLADCPCLDVNHPCLAAWPRYWGVCRQCLGVSRQY
jgi:hypothetical protein